MKHFQGWFVYDVNACYTVSLYKTLEIVFSRTFVLMSTEKTFPFSLIKVAFIMRRCLMMWQKWLYSCLANRALLPRFFSIAGENG